MNILDGFGQPIILGHIYTTVVKYEGQFSIVTGIAERITDNGNLTLRIQSRQRIHGPDRKLVAEKPYPWSRETWSGMTFVTYPLPNQ